MRRQARRPNTTAWLARITCASVALFGLFVHAANRPIPEFVAVKAFAHNEPHALQLLVRVPLAAVKDIQLPTRGDAGYLDLPALKSMLAGAARYWIAPSFTVLENGATVSRPDVVTTRISISADQSFTRYADAVAHLRAGDLSPDEEVFWNQVWLDVEFRYPLQGTDAAAIAVVPKVASLGVRVSTDLQYVAADGVVRAFSFDGDPGVIYLAPRWTTAARQFMARGVSAVIRNADALLLLFCFALPFRRYPQLLPVAVAFAGAAGLALVASGLGWTPDELWYRPLIDVLMAVSILIVACANIAGRVTPRRRALLAVVAGAIFGLDRALGLAGAIQFAGTHTAGASLAFYAGLTIAIAGTVALVVPVMSWLFARARAETLERIIVSALAADTAWIWLTDRWAQLRKIPLQIVIDSESLAPILRALAIFVLFGGVIWFLNEWLKSHRFGGEELGTTSERETTT